MLKEKKKAFTLMEMIITLSVTVIVLGITTSMFIRVTKVFSDSNVKSTLQMEEQAIQEKMGSIGMQAISIDYCNTKDGDVKDKTFGSDEFKGYREDINGNHSVTGEWIDISGIEITSSSKDSNYKVEKDPNTGAISGKITNTVDNHINYNSNSKSLVIGSRDPISTHVKCLRIRPANIKDPKGTVGQANSIEFYMELFMSSGGSSATYPINFTVTFRNISN